MGLLLATGTLEAGKTIDHQFTVRMWINNTVTISDTDYSYTYRSSDILKGDSPVKSANEEGDSDHTKLPHNKESDDREVFSDHYYSIKI